MTGALGLILAYLLGGVPFGYLLVKWKTGTDVRKSGSGNIGATNVLRTTGRSAAVITLLLDIAKGFVAIWITAWLTGNSVGWTSAAAVAVMLGHIFPIYLRFQGGKAVACFLGAFAYLAPIPLLAVLILFAIVVAATKFISLGSIIAAASFPFAVWLILHPDWPLLLAAFAAAVLIVYRHRANIGRLLAGNEHVFSFGGKKP